MLAGANYDGSLGNEVNAGASMIVHDYNGEAILSSRCQYLFAEICLKRRTKCSIGRVVISPTFVYSTPDW
jgi:hypothetical protein